jgi:hypothetical protein
MAAADAVFRKRKMYRDVRWRCTEPTSIPIHSHRSAASKTRRTAPRDACRKRAGDCNQRRKTSIVNRPAPSGAHPRRSIAPQSVSNSIDNGLLV